MKSRSDAILQLDQAEYIERLLPPSAGLLAEMEAYAADHRVPIADREVALFLEITTRAMAARKVLEIGMAIGYAVLHFLRAMPNDGLVVTIEPNAEMIERAMNYFRRADVHQQVRVERGRALDVLPRLTSETFDLLYIDAVKQEYEAYLEASLPLLRSGGVIVADNVLWKGQVAGQAHAPDQQASTQALRDFNQRFVNHPKLRRATLLSVGDGLAYGIKA